jgi:2-succinyl-5-enolpyruvyl-6-hydroxy-3-cyclohexene-1-carboxylate synthase
VNPSTALAWVVVDELVRNGVTDVVLAPGSRSAPLAMACADAETEGRLRLHVRVDERSAAFTALGIGRSTGVPAAIVTTSGTAVANLHPAVLEAHYGNVPLVALTADRPDELRGVGANQTADQIGIFGQSPRLFLDIAAPADRPGQVQYWRSSISRACLAASGALSGDPGPVHVNLALRDPLVPTGDKRWAESLAGRPDGRPWTAAGGRTAGPVSGSAVGHDETVLVLGDAAPALALAAWRVARARGWPVVAEPQWRGGAGVACAPLVVGSADWLGRNAPERVLVVGRPTLSRQVADLVGGNVAPVDVVTSGARWSDAAHAARRVYTERDLAAADPGPVASADLLSTWISAGDQARDVVDRVLDQTLIDGRVPTGIAAVRAALRALPSDAALFLGSSSVIRDANVLGEQFPAVVLTNRGVGGIDGTVSAAVGVALSRRASDGPVYAILGDLAFLHDANGLVIGPDEPRPDLCIVVVNDDGGGIFALLEQGAPEYAAVFERVFGTPHAVDLEALCAASRTPYELVELEKLDAALAPQQGLRVVEIRVDRHHHRDVHARLRTEVAAALA